MAKATTRLTSDALAFLTERHLAMLTTLRSDNSPHVVAVGFTFDPKTHIARVITTGGSQKALNAAQRGVAVLSQVDGARWLSLEGKSTVSHDTDDVRDPVVDVCAAVEAGLNELDGAAKRARADEDWQQAKAAGAGERKG